MFCSRASKMETTNITASERRCGIIKRERIKSDARVRIGPERQTLRQRDERADSKVNACPQRRLSSLSDAVISDSGEPCDTWRLNI